MTGTSGSTFLQWSTPIIYAYDTVQNITKKACVVETISSNTACQVTTTTFASEVNSTYHRTEITTAWNSPKVQTSLSSYPTQATYDNIYWMFSLNFDAGEKEEFFGNWYLPDFMSFITNLTTNNNASGKEVFVAYNPSSPSSPNIYKFRPNKYVIYNYNFTQTRVGGQINASGRSVNWHLSEPDNSF